MKDRFLRLLMASAAAVAVSWPIVGYQATAEKGVEMSFVPALQVGGIVLATGVAYMLWLFLWSLIPKSASSAVGGAARKPGVQWASIAVLLGILAFVPQFASRGNQGLLLETLVFCTIAIGLNISMGMAGLLVLGHAAFWAVGGYTFCMLTIHFDWNFWLAFPAAGAAAALVGLVIGLPALRLRGDYLAIVTLGFGEAIRWVFKNESEWTGGDAGIPGSEVPGNILKSRGWIGEWMWQPTTRAEVYWFALGLLVVCVVCVTLLTRSRYGRALFALREDETAAKCMGINTVKVKLIAFMASAMWAGLAGVIHPIFRGQITPQIYDFNASVLFVSMVVLGGLGSVPGSILGAAILWILPNMLRNYIPEVQDYRMLIFGAVLAAMMVIRPEGLMGTRDHAEDEEDDEGTPGVIDEPAGPLPEASA